MRQQGDVFHTVNDHAGLRKMNRNAMKRPDFFLPVCALALLFVGATGFAQQSATIIQQKKMAFSRLKESGLSRDEAETFSMYLQIALADATQWEIMDFSVTKALIVERGGTENCTDLQCEIINGQLLSVDYMCFGSIETIGRTFSLNVQVADIGSGRTVANVSKYAHCHVIAIRNPAKQFTLPGNMY